MNNITEKLLYVEIWINLLFFKSHSIKRNTVAKFFSTIYEHITHTFTQTNKFCTSNLYALAMQVRYFFALNCKNYQIRGPPVQF